MYLNYVESEKNADIICYKMTSLGLKRQNLRNFNR